jgi:hypothetical protein
LRSTGDNYVVIQIGVEPQRAQHQLDDARGSRDAQPDDAVRFWSLTINRRKITRWLFWPFNI